jgi:succinate-semialdehyde dehydrogenase/glutarate-semialdehyde dehydrogenase
VSAPLDLAQEALVPVDPATLQPVGRVAVTEPEGVAEAVAEARLVQRAWAARPLADRADLLRRVAREIVADDLALAHRIVDESGKPVVEAYTHDLFVAVEALGWLAGALDDALGDRRLPFRQPVLLHKRGWVRHEPLGVVGIVAPWNFPIGLPLSQAATAVAAGNAVVLKPSELTPLSGVLIEELFRRAGAPAGLVRVVQGPGAVTGDALVSQPGIDAIVFTGSTATGRVVARRAAERLCPITLELGGKDPMIVLDDADLDRAVEGALWGSFANCGQVCSGVERIYVARALLEPFVAALAARAASLSIGDGHLPTTELGPLVTERQRRVVEDIVADAVEHGASVVTGGNRPATDLPGWFHEPTVLLGEPASARIRREEIFGPVVTVVEFDNDEEAVRRANDSRFALGASVWTRDRRRGRAVAARLSAGSVWLNDHAYSYGAAQAPWGGRGASGMGRTHGREGLTALSHVKYVDADRGRIRPGWWYPYSDAVLDGFRGILGGLYGDGLGPRLSALATHRAGVAHLVRKALS